MHPSQFHKMKRRHKLKKNQQNPRRNDNNFRSQHPEENENWEKEIEECARSNEYKDQPPYDSGDELNTTEMISYDVQNSANINHQDHYIPAAHHTHPVKWVRYIYAKVADQFSDAEE